MTRKAPERKAEPARVHEEDHQALSFRSLPAIVRYSCPDVYLPGLASSYSFKLCRLRMHMLESAASGRSTGRDCESDWTVLLAALELEAG